MHIIGSQISSADPKPERSRLEQNRNIVNPRLRRPVCPASQNPEPPPPFRRLNRFLQFRLRQFTIGGDGNQTVPHLADMLIGTNPLLATDRVTNQSRAPSRK